MNLPIAARLGTPVHRTSLFYFSLYMLPAVANPYLPLWLADQGISETEIGTINAVPIFVMILLNLVVGRIADKASDWRQVIIFGALFAGIIPVGLFFVQGFWSILIVWALIIVPFQAIAPVADAATIRLARRTGANFGAIRLWGTIGFMCMTLTAGVLLDQFGVSIFVTIILAVSLFRGLISLQLPYFRAHEGVQSEPGTKLEPLSEFQPVSPLVATRLKEIWRPWFFLPLLGASLLHGSHMLQMTFGALLWREQGISAAIIGPLWAVAPAGEILVMLYFNRIATRFSARHLIFLATVFAVVRWLGFAMAPPIWGYVLLQLLHLGSFALAYMGIVNFIANWTSENISAQAQSAFVVIRQVATVIAMAGSGFLVATIGNQAFYVAAFVAALGGALVLISLMLMSPKREMREQVLSKS
ncbi:MFS transporter [Mariluticola halotolerans]|uniref:MFS transporter n=1 Tax=Mariluticola halotolerans TaxID=2909283 RepID=UPI0026E366D5|nr:MFS transporter [Mariluticola halotolerans]UJQ95451.1 MFS transporter [Mariluticola halotolerans]